MAGYIKKKTMNIKELFRKQMMTNRSREGKLKYSDEYFKRVGKFRPDVMLILSSEKELLSNNEREVCDFFGIESLDPNQVLGIIPESSFEELIQSFEQALSGSSNYHELTVWNQRKNMSMYIVITFHPIPSVRNPVKGVYITIQDNSSYMTTLETFANQKRRIEFIRQTINVGSWEYDLETKSMVSVENVAYVLGLPSDHDFTSPEQLLSLIHPEDQKHCRPLISEAFKSGTGYTLEFRIYHGKTNEIRFLKLYLKMRWSGTGHKSVITGIIQDITDMQQNDIIWVENQSLANLPHEYQLYAELDKAKSSDGDLPIALIMLGIDHFYSIYEEMGMNRGKQITKVIAERVSKSLPDHTFVAYCGSGTFAILLKNWELKKDICKQIEHLLKKIAEPIEFNWEEEATSATASAGISLYTKDCKNHHLIIDQAVAALNCAQQSGINNYQCYNDCKEVFPIFSNRLKNEFHNAWLNNEINVLFMPNIFPKSGSIIGAEMLLHWENTYWKDASQNQLLELAEECNIMRPLSDWLIKEACLQLKSWRDQNFSFLPLTIRVPLKYLMSEGFPDYVREQLIKNDVPSHLLEFKLMSGWPQGKRTKYLQQLHKLKEVGVSMSIGNIGTKQVALSQLAEIPVDTLIIQDTMLKYLKNGSEKEKSILSVLVYLARNMEIKFAAEGVTEPEELNFLIQKDCDSVQGPLYSEPKTVLEFTNLLEKRTMKPRNSHKVKLAEERREFYRFVFPFPVLAEMTISKIKDRKVALGTAPVLIDDIGLGGIRNLTSLKLPVNSPMLYEFKVKLLGEEFLFNGELVWKQEVREGVFQYGVKFMTQEAEQDRLANVINQMTVLRKVNKNIPSTEFIHENPYSFIRNYHGEFDR